MPVHNILKATGIRPNSSYMKYACSEKPQTNCCTVRYKKCIQATPCNLPLNHHLWNAIHSHMACYKNEKDNMSRSIHISVQNCSRLVSILCNQSTVTAEFVTKQQNKKRCGNGFCSQVLISYAKILQQSIYIIHIENNLQTTKVF